MRLVAITLGFVFVSIAALAACGDSEPEVDADATATSESLAATAEAGQAAANAAAEAQYLAKFEAYFEQLDSMVRSIDQSLSQTYPVAARLFEVLQAADVSETVQAVLTDIEQLTPPDRFRDDHERYVRALSDTVPFAQEHDRAIEVRDLVSVFVARSRMLAAQQRALAEASPAICRAAAIEPRAATFCDTGDPLPGGEYGVELRTVFKRYSAEFGPRVSSFPAAFTPEERFQALEVLQPEIEQVLDETAESVRALEPPTELRADHDRLVLFLEETLDVARAITQAAEDRDFDRTQVEFIRSGTVLCDAHADLSATMKRLLAFYFPPQACEDRR